LGAPYVESLRVMFPAALDGSPRGTVDGLWGQGANGSLQLLARKGDPAPGLPGQSFSSFDSWVFHNQDIQPGPRATISATTDGGLAGVWRGPAGGLQLMAAQGAAAPGTNDASTFASFSDVRGTGFHAAFRAELANAPAGKQSGIWWGTPGDVRLAARTGEPAPGAAGANFTAFGAPTMLFPANGEIAFQATLDTPTAAQGIWWGLPGGIQIVHRSGDQVPGAGVGVAFDTFGSPQATPIDVNLQELVFTATHKGSGVNDGNNAGLFGGDRKAPVLVARTGDAAPGAAGLHFARLDDPVVSGFRIGFKAALAGQGANASNDDSVWVAQTGNQPSLTMLAREGQPAPGAPGAVFASFETPAPFFTPVFVATLAGPGVDDSNDRGIWSLLSSLQTQPTLILREGDQFTVAPGDVRTIERLVVAPTHTQYGGESTWTPASRYITFAADFTDGSSGVFTYNFVPEPAVATWLLAAPALLLRRRRR